MRLQPARVASLEKRAAVATRREPRAIAYVKHPDGRLEVPRSTGWEPVAQSLIDEILLENGLVIELAYDPEAFSCPTTLS